MAINVDTVYKTVLLILNQQQRGYMTPDEFNKVAAQVQLNIFEKYEDDLNQQYRTPQNDTEYANRIKNIEENLQNFQKYINNASVAGAITGTNPFTIHTAVVRLLSESDLRWMNFNGLQQIIGTQRVENMRPLDRKTL